MLACILATVPHAASVRQKAMPGAAIFEIPRALNFTEPFEFDFSFSCQPHPFQEKIIRGNGMF